MELTTARIVRIVCFAIVLSATVGAIKGNVVGSFGEGSPVTIASIFMLLATAVVNYRIFRIRAKSGFRLREAASVWLLIAAGFLFLAIDEAAQIHENLDRLMHYLLSMRETALTDRADDLIVAFYGLIGIGVLYVYRSELVRFRVMLPYLAAGFALFSVQVLLDVATNRSEYVHWLGLSDWSAALVKQLSGIAEECIKLSAEAVFLLGFVRVLRDLTRSAQTQAQAVSPARGRSAAEAEEPSMAEPMPSAAGR